MSSDPNDRSNSPDTGAEPAATPQAPEPTAEKPAPAEPVEAEDSTAGPQPAPEPAAPEQPAPESPDSTGEPAAAPPRPRRILIGSQRDAAAYRPKPTGGSIRIVGMKRSKPRKKDKDRPKTGEKAPAQSQPGVQERPGPSHDAPAREEPRAAAEQAASEEIASSPEAAEQAAPAVRKKFPPPSIRGRLSADLEEEFQEALADVPLDDLISGGEEITRQPMLETDGRHTGRVVMIRREDAFVELGGREQGILPLKQFDEPPEIGAEVEVRVVRFHREDGLYELSRAGSASRVADWSDLEEGMLVEAKVTGHNTGGLECEVNRIRGFIPVSQISLYRVENLAEFVDEKFTCLVTEANPRRNNLVLSRRAVLEREREETRQNLLQSLEPGQEREGVVRKLADFGAFVDLGGVDGLVHVSQLAWGRVNHPREVLQVGQTIKVRVQSVDQATARISLAYRDLLESPWADVEMKYPVTSTVHGKVTKLMEFGAFVELEPGVEGLVHISELSHKRVWRASDVVKEGEEIDAVVLSVDSEAQRISLSMKDTLPEPEAPEQAESSEAQEPAPPPKHRKEPAKPLQGGLGRSTEGDKFGLKW